MKKTIFEREMENPAFRGVYNEVSAKLSIGEEIARLRCIKKMTQTELARKVKTSRTAISRYESGNYERYSLDTLKRIAKALNKKIEISFV
ncbi:MAG TPA: helix-turn-helix transcriptional regulator [Candidatus Omnitrophota bacterium]|nr:helix-turn-helix transcriptional regulator [Candidatus Omnitrophota bacterium]